MTRTYFYEATVCLGDDESAEFDVKATFTVAWGKPATGCFGPIEGYDEGSSHLVEDVRIYEVEGMKAGWSQFAGGFSTDAQVADILTNNLLDHHADRMLFEAIEEDDGRREEAAEYRAEARREALAERIA